MIWEAQKDLFFKRWRNQNPGVVAFDSSITQYIELSNKVQQKDTITPVDFVLLDCSALKFGIIAHCDEWQNRFHALLHEIASQKLNDIYTALDENTKRCLLSLYLPVHTYMYTLYMYPQDGRCIVRIHVQGHLN